MSLGPGIIGQQVSTFFSIDNQHPDRASQFIENADSVSFVSVTRRFTLLSARRSWHNNQ
jgi:hypothetical protein